jgi:hypothetical protein
MNTLRYGMVVGTLSVLGCAGETLTQPSGEEDQLGTAAHDLRVSGRSNPCDLVRCRSGFVCQVSDGAAACVPDALGPKDPSKIECKTDADCTLVADYCGGCNCLALASGESAPICRGDEVACFVWPCQGLAAFCDQGQCAVDAQQ